jgi:hypothetical protein
MEWLRAAMLLPRGDLRKRQLRSDPKGKGRTYPPGAISKISIPAGQEKDTPFPGVTFKPLFLFVNYQRLEGMSRKGQKAPFGGPGEGVLESLSGSFSRRAGEGNPLLDLKIQNVPGLPMFANEPGDQSEFGILEIPLATVQNFLPMGFTKAPVTQEGALSGQGHFQLLTPMILGYLFDLIPESRDELPNFFRRQGERTVQPSDLLTELFFLDFQGNLGDPDLAGEDFIKCGPIKSLFDPFDQEPFFPVAGFYIGHLTGLERRTVAYIRLPVDGQFFQGMLPVNLQKLFLVIQIVCSPFHSGEFRGGTEIPKKPVLGDDFVALGAAGQFLNHVGFSLPGFSVEADGRMNRGKGAVPFDLF